jgi:DNA-binding transcriptional regulator YiaG
MSLSDRIKSIHGNCSRSDFASLMGAHRVTVRLWENEGVTPTLDFIDMAG